MIFLFSLSLLRTKKKKDLYLSRAFIFPVPGSFDFASSLYLDTGFYCRFHSGLYFHLDVGFVSSVNSRFLIF